MNPQYDFRNNIALVTGAGKGMGLATPTAFAESGPPLRSRTSTKLRSSRSATSSSLRVIRRLPCAATSPTRRMSPPWCRRPSASFGRLDAASKRRRCPKSRDRRGRRERRKVRPVQRDQPSWRVGLHEARAPSDAGRARVQSSTAPHCVVSWATRRMAYRRCAGGGFQAVEVRAGTWYGLRRSWPLGSRAEPPALPSWSGGRTVAGASRASNDVGVR